MLDRQTIIIILVILGFIVVIYYLTRSLKSNTSPMKVEKMIDKEYPYIPEIERSISPPNIKPVFLDVQYHNDYRDVQTAFNNMVVSDKQIFNVANRPLKYSEPSEAEVMDLMNDFINSLNHYVKDVPDHRNANSGWDEAIPDPNMETGWERQRRALGLEPSLYAKPLGKTEVFLVAIEKVQKYDTEDETKYTVIAVIQKNGADDQMLVKISFVIDKQMLNDENNFFKEKELEVSVVIESIFIEGFLSDHGVDAQKQFKMTKDKLASFDSLENQNMTDPMDVMKELKKQYTKRLREMELRNSTLDEDGQDIHLNRMDLGATDSFKVTQTIEDDLMNRNRHFA